MGVGFVGAGRSTGGVGPEDISRSWTQQAPQRLGDRREQIRVARKHNNPSVVGNKHGKIGKRRKNSSLECRTQEGNNNSN